MKKFLTKLRFFSPKVVSGIPLGSIILTVLVIAVGILNYQPGTTLTGWDNLHPEFALEVNIKRSIFAVWQEYQGLGLLGGMGHASDLVRQILLVPLTWIAPLESVRYIATFLSFLAGGLGAYFLLKTVLLPYEKNRELISTMGGLFYLLNIATMQTYYVAFEAFINHYAALPWLLLGSLLFIKNGTKKTLAILSIIVLLATPAGYIPTLFVAFLIALTILNAGIFFLTSNKRKTLIRIFKAYLIIFAINAFWLLPFLYFTITSSSVNVDAKMNQMATETIFLQNKEYGNLQNVVKLHGFWFSNVDPDLSGNFRQMFSPWINHFKNQWINSLSLISFAVILIGIFSTVKNRRPLHLVFLFLFFFAFTMLATDTPVFSTIVELFRKIPLFGQAFRFPFTKFSILAALMYSVFFAFGMAYLLKVAGKFMGKVSIPLISLLLLGILVINALPVFQGKLFYEKEQITIPDDYRQTFDFFAAQDPNARIANFPQHTFWGWNFYTWGYGGSGFLWYGIKQPILDRAFDVWSDELENYYYEISNALYAKDAQKVAQVLNKYQVRWVLVDRSVYSPFAPKAIHLDETQSILSQIPGVQLRAQYGSVFIYSVKLLNEPQNYVFSTPVLPKVNGTQWNNDDNIYHKFGNYAVAQTSDLYLPFRSLFSYRSQDDLEYAIKEENEKFYLSAIIPDLKEKTLNLPSYAESEELIPVEFYSEELNGEIILSARLLTPEITVGQTTITKPLASIPMFIIPSQLAGRYTLNANGLKEYGIDFSRPVSQKTYLSLKQDNVFTLSNASTGELQSNVIGADYIASTLQTLPSVYTLTSLDSGKKLTVTLPKIIDGYFGYIFEGDNFEKAKDCNAFRKGENKTNISHKKLTIESTNDTVCTSAVANTLPHNASYLIRINSENLSGRPFHFWTQNLDQKYAPVDTYLPHGDAVSTIILSPMEDYGQGYSFHFENLSIGNRHVSNSLHSLSVTAFPYTFVKNISIGSIRHKDAVNVHYKVTHPNESLYRLTGIAPSNSPFTLVLSQSFDKGWAAFVVGADTPSILAPFAGERITPHMQVNGWENGWEINDPKILNGKEVVITYLPQYLQYAGFLLGIIPFLLLLSWNKAGIFYTRFNDFFEVKALKLKSKILV